MWKRISFVILAWIYGPSPHNPEDCSHPSEEPHNNDCPVSYSGWKAHVYGENQEDISTVMKAVKPLADHYGWGYKTADDRTLEALHNHPLQHGKAVTVYFPNHVTWGDEANHLANSMEALGYRSGETPNIHGDFMSGTVGVRYELSDNCRGRNVGPDEYHANYVPNRG